mmetsp:Transcript_40375/g.104518  ORF Transcript_40375/g.104518 Transcript_40375/m.104518 type:complete len:213 (+) Transcript_40375:351-989(+)
MHPSLPQAPTSAPRGTPAWARSGLQRWPRYGSKRRRSRPWADSGSRYWSARRCGWCWACRREPAATPSMCVWTTCAPPLPARAPIRRSLSSAPTTTGLSSTSCRLGLTRAPRLPLFRSTSAWKTRGPLWPATARTIGPCCASRVAKAWWWPTPMPTCWRCAAPCRQGMRCTTPRPPAPPASSRACATTGSFPRAPGRRRQLQKEGLHAPPSR